ncbi:MAG: DUF423 domain-containing protein [Planctomycetaceae bacterium]|jgi:uncharacterized membrane protein YgdD (TMEM256/DUF423 family)
MQVVSPMNARLCLTLAALSGFLGVALGAFGAHGLNDTKFLENRYAELPEKNVAGQKFPASYKYFRDFETGVEYQLTHTAALLAVGLLMLYRQSRLLVLAAWCFCGGIVFFSGALYVLVICGPKAGGIPWGAVAPVGGTMQLIGWLALAAAALRLPTTAPQDLSNS